MDYDEITAVSCWIDFAWDVGIDLDGEQLTSDGRQLHPRLWKSHQRLAAINPGCRYIVVIREPSKVAASYYHFYASKGLTRDLPVDEWTREWASEQGATWCGNYWNCMRTLRLERAAGAGARLSRKPLLIEPLRVHRSGGLLGAAL